MNFTLLSDWQGQSVEGFLMSQKYDGWRTGISGGKLLTRGGNFLNSPQWFVNGLPDGLDCELWAGLGNFHSIQGLMRDGWHGLRLMVFDAVMPGTFRQRLQYLKTLKLPAHCQMVEHIRCRGTEHLIEFADAIVEAGGEGAVVRDPRAVYQPGRSGSVLRWVPIDPEVNRRVA